MKKTKHLWILNLLIALFAVFAAAMALTGCEPEESASAKKTVTVTVDFALQDRENATFTTEEGANFYYDLVKVTLPASEFEFGGYLFGGEAVTADTAAPDHDFTVTAQWLVSYTEEHWLEQADGTFAKDGTLTRSLKGALGTEVTAEEKTVQGYVADPDAADTVRGATLDKSGIVLRLYYKLERYALSFDRGLASAAAGEMQPVEGKFNETIVLPACGYTSQTAEFFGYNTAPDNSGDSYSAGESFTLTGDATLYAVWRTTVTQTVYTEEDDNSGNFVKGEDITFAAIVGSTAECRNPDVSKYVPCDHEGSVPSGTVTEGGLTLVRYFELRSFTVTYAEDGATETVVWGQTCTVRTPENADPTQLILSYSTSATGNGRDYAFGAAIEVRQDITLYPVIVDVYTDDAGSGDTVRVRRNMTGLGSATLVRGGTEYRGFLEVNEDAGTVEFSVNLDDDTACYGRLYQSEEKGMFFRYRGTEAGTYLAIDPLYYDAENGERGMPYSTMLALDGYGAGVLAIPEENGDRVENYACTYQYNETTEDYYLRGQFPATGKEIELYFTLLQKTVEIGEGQSLDGYFMEYNAEFDGNYFYLYNWEIDADYVLDLDGYGNAKWYDVVVVDPETGEEELSLRFEGVYCYADYFSDDPEMVFIPTSGDPFYFIVQTMTQSEQSVRVFLTRHNEEGEYKHSDSTNPSTLYLDGYGGAYYSADGTAESEAEGFYTIEPTEGTENAYSVIITFLGEDGTVQGKLALSIDLAQRTFSIFEDGFVIDANGVLTQYLGSNSAIEIPEGVKEIAAGTFKGMFLTSVIFPATLEKIGDYAFESSSVSGGSALTSVTFRSENPPTLGADVFRWIKGNFKIFVPDGKEEAYRTAFAAATPSQPDGYAKYITSQAEQSDKPLYEVKDGVLVSYNNKDTDPANVEIVIPEGVTEIADGVFNGISYIVSADLTGVTKIGQNAFRGCANLRSVTFDPAILSIGASAFYECALTEVQLGSVGAVGELAFARNFGLVSVTFGGKVGTIAQKAFRECGRITDAEETEVTPLEFKIAFHGSDVPELSGLVFDGVLQLRVYVDNFDIAMAYAETESWVMYATGLRIKAEQSETWYCKSEPAAKLEIGDRIMFNETYLGLYERVGGKLHVCWLEYSAFEHRITLIENELTVANGEMTGMDVTDAGDDNRYVFVAEGTVLTYLGAADRSETMEITFGSTAGKFCGEDVVIDYSNYRTRFDFGGYTYTVSFGNNLTFTYTRQKIVVTRAFTSADGSSITIREGDSIYANGFLKDVNGIVGPNGNGLETEVYGWYLTKVSDTVYTFRTSWLNVSYAIFIQIESDTTFSYSWELASTILTYSDGNGDVAVVTKQADGTVTSIHILFKTSNGTEEVIAAFTPNADGSFAVEINSTVTETDENGEETTRPSEFNGAYTLTLDEGAHTFTLTAV